MQELLGLLGMGGGGLLAKGAYDKLEEVGSTGMSQSASIGDTANDMTNFTGYGVTGPAGNTQVDEFGSTTMTLDPNQQGYADQARLGSEGMMAQAMGSPGDREADIYARIRAMQQPGEDRQRQQMMGQQAQKGQLGISSGMYGGTPQALAMEKAQAEARNSASYEAIKLAREQQGQDLQGAKTLGALQYAPQSALLDAFGAGSTAYNYEDIARRQGATAYAEANMGGLDSLLGASLGQANLMGNLGSSLIGGGMGMMGQAINNGSTPLMNKVTGFFGL